MTAGSAGEPRNLGISDKPTRLPLMAAPGAGLRGGERLFPSQTWRVRAAGATAADSRREIGGRSADLARPADYTEEVSEPVHRRLQLPANDRSPAAARAAVREVLQDSGMRDLMDEALLLTTELTTNGVVHAGTDIQIDAVGNEAGLRVTVTDFRSGSVEPADTTPPDVTAEGGRGLLLVDQFATAWGTTHDAIGKSIWFRLARPGSGDDAQAHVATQSIEAQPLPETYHDVPHPVGSINATEISQLLSVSSEMQNRLSLPRLVEELLHRLQIVTGAAGARATIDYGDTRGENTLASCGSQTQVTFSAPIPVNSPHRGRLHLFGQKPENTSWDVPAALSAERIALAVEVHRLRTDERERSGWLNFLAGAGEILAHSLREDLTVALIPQLVVPRLGQWAAVHLVTSTPQAMIPRLASVQHASEAELPHYRKLLTEAADGVTEELNTFVHRGMEVPLPHPLEGIAVPLEAGGNVLGVLSVGRPEGRAHTAEERDVIIDLAKRCALALDNAHIHTEREQVARDFQAALMPQALPEVPWASFAAEYLPATSFGTHVGGDFYDVMPLTEGRVWASIGDVCGKGAQAAAVTGIVRDVLRVMIRDGRPLPRALELLNLTLLDQPDNTRYATVASAILHHKEGGMEAQLCLSGHDRPLLLRADGGTEWVGREGTAVGLLPEIKTQPVTVPMGPGDALVLFTDGVTERREGSQMFGLDRITQVLRPAAGESAEAIAARLRSAVEEFSMEAPRDDMAILVLRAK
ncbi:SpoIIE family protein phosphatase [Natronoglycomyces albus]|uniref:SpoIIE family protein phosphatase n=1 Tax=Natronoglycomyces albus TaxID=2811108 RepID=A0A895XTJ1_9ACTN|nr:SpoIIE family protein phosphatase [Natronoglycomyces albus]QSB05570.1 SpoIIE family protein phosphatase [Natronoglycomyces albus]